MGAPPTTADQPLPRRLQRPLWPLALAAGVALVVLVLLTARRPALGAAAAAALAVTALLVARPQAGLVLFSGVLYANLVAVAIKFHGAPAAAALALPALLAAPIAEHVFRHRRGVVVPPELPFVLLFVLAQVLGTLFARDVPLALESLKESLLEGVLLYLLFVNAARSPRALWHTLWALLAAGLMMGIVPVAQQATGNFDQTFGGLGQVLDTPFSAGDGRAAQFRLSGPIGETNRYSQVMLMLVPLGLVAFWHARTIAGRGVGLLVTLVTLGGFALAFSRGSAVAAVGLFVVMLALRVVSLRQSALIVGAGLVVLLAVPQYRDRLATLPGVSTLLHGHEPEPDGAVKGRLTEMIAAAQVFADHPILGVGPGMFPYYCKEYGNRLNIRRLDDDREAHCLYLELGAETGVVGVVGFAGMVWMVLARLLRQRRRWLGHPRIAALATAALLMLLAYLATAVFLHMSYLRYFWFALALASATGIVLQRGPPESRQRKKRKKVAPRPRREAA